VAPDGIVTVGRTVDAKPGTAERWRTQPPVGDLPVRVTDPPIWVPPFVLFGESEKVFTSGGNTWSCLVIAEVPWLALIPTNEVPFTGLVVTVKLAEDEPAGIVIEAGTVATAVLLEFSVTL